MRRVILESPYAGDNARNLKYAHECIADCLARDEAPFASHVLYTTALDDNDPAERSIGINAGQCWMSRADAVVVYEDHGVSSGMQMGIEKAKAMGVPVERRRIYQGGLFDQ